MSKLHGKIEAIFGLDVRSLALFRIFLGANLIADLFIRSLSLKAFYTDSGLLPRTQFVSQLSSPWTWSLHLMGGTLFSQAVLFLIAGLFALSLLVGYRTRLMTFLSWLMLASLHNRLPYIQNSGDVYLRLSLFWSFFIPLGACWSVDRVLSPPDQKVPSQVITGGTVALVLQAVIVYLMASIPKFQGNDWFGTGKAVYYTLRLEIFATHAAHALLRFPQMLTGLTYGVMFFEAAGAFMLIFPILTGPVRTVTLMLFALMHLAFGICLRVDPFPRSSLLELIPLLPTWFWLRLDTLSKRWPVRVAKLTNLLPLVEWKAWLLSHFARRPLPLKQNGWSHVAALGFFVLGIYFIVSLTVLRVGQPVMNSPLIGVCRVFGLDQAWSMFAPEVARRSGWIVIPGILGNGRAVDLYKNGAPVSWDPPALVSATYQTERWRRFFAVLLGGDRGGYHVYSQYLCRDWNGSHSGGDQLESFQIMMMATTAMPDGSVEGPAPVVLWRAACFPPNLPAKTPSGPR